MSYLNFLISATWCRVMQMVNVTYGIGKQRNCTKNGKHMTEYVLMYSGIRMNLLDSPPLDGMEKSSIGIKGSLT